MCLSTKNKSISQKGDSVQFLLPAVSNCERLVVMWMAGDRRTRVSDNGKREGSMQISIQ